MNRISIAILCAIVGATERWLLGQSAGDVVVSGIGLGIGYILCSPHAHSLQSHLRIAALLIGLVLANDLLSLAITSGIDGTASLQGGSWLIVVIVTWMVLSRPKVSQWVGLQPIGDGAPRG